jgi:hypothetical protein
MHAGMESAKVLASEDALDALTRAILVAAEPPTQ